LGSLELENPWADLPSEPPYIAACDREVLDRHPEARDRLNFEILPYPFQGAKEADVLFLLANPGAGELPPGYPADLVEERGRSLTFTHQRDPRFATPDTWWHRRLRKLIAAVGEETVSSRTLSVEYFPYHSRRYRRFPEVLPSQEFGFGIVRDAVSAGKLVVVVRQEKAWLRAVPELEHADYIAVPNPRVAHISPRNVGEDNFNRIVDRLERPVGREEASAEAAVEPLREGTFLRWSDRGGGALGIVVPPVTDEMVRVLLTDSEGNTGLEVFVGRPDATGVKASQFALEQMEIIDNPGGDLADLLIDESMLYAEDADRETQRAMMDASEPVTGAVEGYCVKERKMVRIKDARSITTPSGKPAISGTCPDCGVRIFKAAPDT
jgi:hypothetical protein